MTSAGVLLRFVPFCSRLHQVLLLLEPVLRQVVADGVVELHAHHAGLRPKCALPGPRANVAVFVFTHPPQVELVEGSAAIGESPGEPEDEEEGLDGHISAWW